MARKIIITSDPGQDQAIALFMILASPEDFEVLGIVATAGNVGLDLASKNVRRILQVTGRMDIPVYLGSAAPIARELVTAEHVHGPSGMDGAELPCVDMDVRPQSGVDFIVETLLAEPASTVSIVSLSPLTNLGRALIAEPEIAERIQEVVMMAGAYFEVGNITPSAEFNVFVDPEAAHAVFESGAPITVLPLDVTHRMLSTPERLQRLRAMPNLCGPTAAGLLTFSQTFDLRKYGWNGAPLHGPCVPAVMLHPEMFSSRKVNLCVETRGEHTAGMTVVDWWQITDKPRNVTYVRDGNADALYDLICERIARLP